ncbi:MAG: hypothetical protein WBB01_01515, partial [Phormidesmis sp.]
AMILGIALSELMSELEQKRSDQGKFMQVSDEPLAKNIKGARFPVSIDALIAQLPNQSEYIRSAVIDRLKADGILKEK